MEQRYIKIGLALTVGLLAALWSINNVLNWKVAEGAVAYVLSQDNQSGYAAHLVPPIKSSLAATIGLIMIVAAEAVAGSLALFGAWRMGSQRNAQTVAFEAAKRFAILGAGIAVLTWFLGFQVIGGAAINMGQAEGLSAALEGAFRFGSYSFLTLIYLSLPEPERSPS